MSRISKALARVLAVLALAAVALALFLVVSSALDDDGADKDKPKVQRNNPNRNPNGNGDRPEREGPARFYIVQPGDSLSLIAEKTGVSLERLQQLNPDIDPQLLPSGEKLRLR
jgi:hypothetical protein